ncbi:hypothetical protein [Pseudolysinimonas sp.]|uniref:hypothetical protein n=1 Tax=Pseudolysinimonas sp. TaxID=2680009 RepID=UPI00286C3D7B|nr:hypothetical protein [Pseudolysinimonas sp.]
MRFPGRVAIASCVVVVAFAALLSGGSAAAQGELTPTPTGAAPITVVIPGAATASPSSTAKPSASPSGSPSSPPSTNGCEAGPGQANADGSPIPGGAPASDALDLRLDDDRVTADSWVIATASGFLPGEYAQVVMYSGAVVIGSYTVGADGAFSARFRIPEDTPTGNHVVEVTGWTSGCVANDQLTVVAGGEGGSGGLPANWLSLWWVFVVLGALFIGLLSLGVAFRGDIASWFGRAPSGGSTA